MFALSTDEEQYLREVLGAVPDELVHVSIAEQRLTLIRGNTRPVVYPVSTSAFGVGNAENSNQTPRGIHRIARKIGDGAPIRRIFRGRCDTGEDWDGGEREENLILTRIMWLEGLEDGVNRGAGIDSHERYIYIHGTNREDRIGNPASHGCVLMSSPDVIDLYQRVSEGTIVFIN